MWSQKISLPGRLELTSRIIESYAYLACWMDPLDTVDDC